MTFNDWYWQQKKNWHDFLWMLNPQNWAKGPAAMSRDYYQINPEDPKSSTWLKTNPTPREVVDKVAKDIFSRLPKPGVSKK